MFLCQPAGRLWAMATLRAMACQAVWAMTAAVTLALALLLLLLLALVEAALVLLMAQVGVRCLLYLRHQCRRRRR